MITLWMIVGTILFAGFVILAYMFSDRIPLPQPKGRLIRRATRQRAFALFGRKPGSHDEYLLFDDDGELIKYATTDIKHTLAVFNAMQKPKPKTIYDEVVAELGFDPLAPKPNRFNFPLAS